MHRAHPLFQALRVAPSRCDQVYFFALPFGKGQVLLSKASLELVPLRQAKTGDCCKKGADWQGRSVEEVLLHCSDAFTCVDHVG
jgi:hypothetical protein